MNPRKQPASETNFNREIDFVLKTTLAILEREIALKVS